MFDGFRNIMGVFVIGKPGHRSTFSFCLFRIIFFSTVEPCMSKLTLGFGDVLSREIVNRISIWLNNVVACYGCKIPHQVRMTVNNRMTAKKEPAHVDTIRRL